MKRAIIVHGWGGTPEEGWFPWLKAELEKSGFEVVAPILPDTENPRIDTWVPALARAVGAPDANTYFIGHSMGCQTIARYLETLPAEIVVGGVVYIGGYFDSLTLGEHEEQEIWNAWRNAPVDLSLVYAHAPKSVAIFSDDDPFVPLDNLNDFRDKLNSEIVVEHGKKHFTEDSGCRELPVALESVLKLAQD